MQVTLKIHGQFIPAAQFSEHLPLCKCCHFNVFKNMMLNMNLQCQVAKRSAGLGAGFFFLNY